MLSYSGLYSCQDTLPGLRITVAEVCRHAELVVLHRGAGNAPHPTHISIDETGGKALKINSAKPNYIVVAQ